MNYLVIISLNKDMLIFLILRFLDHLFKFQNFEIIRMMIIILQMYPFLLLDWFLIIIIDFENILIFSLFLLNSLLLLISINIKLYFQINLYQESKLFYFIQKLFSLIHCIILNLIFTTENLEIKDLKNQGNLLKQQIP